MKIQPHTRMKRRWLRRVAVGAAALAVAVPTAPALGGIPPEPVQPAPDSTRAAQPSPSDGATATSGFDWGDAAAGLGVGLAASLVLAGAVIGVQRRRGTLADA